MDKFSLLLLSYMLIFITSHNSQAARDSQLVMNLKGQPTVNFKQYAGHVTVNESHGRALFYWFYEADHSDAPNLPLVLWLNGGPGCSSIGNGALRELGPFFANDAGDGLLISNYSWSKAANIIFLESPFGTGFSYSNTSLDYQYYEDELIAEDTFAFLIGWFKEFPEYASNDFYLAGESYAGHYIPTLARMIVKNNKKTDAFHIIFKGFMIGNPWTSAYHDNKGTSNFYYSHSLISEETYEAILANCDFASDLPVDDLSENKTCREAVSQAEKDMRDIDVYNIYGYSCNSESSSTFKKAYLSADAYNTCIDGVSLYLNDPLVQSSLHVSSTTWSGCSRNVYTRYKRGDIVASMLPIYRKLLGEGLRIWIYSGDVDGVVSTTGTKSWIRTLNLTIEIPWHAWKYRDQVGGWTQIYRGLTFATVRGAGHMVPAFQPGPALLLFQTFLRGERLPTF